MNFYVYALAKRSFLGGDLPQCSDDYGWQELDRLSRMATISIRANSGAVPALCPNMWVCE